jgi:hypothetical protein
MMATVDHPYRAAPFFPEADWLVADHQLTVPYQGQARMRLLFAAGISDLVLRVDPLQTELLRAQFDGPVPRVVVTPDELCVRYRFGFGDWIGGLLMGEASSAVISLHSRVAWELVCRGGASEVDADLRRGRLASIEISGGASEVALALPAPGDVVPIRLRGGASEVAIQRPERVPVRVQISGGCMSLEVDDRHVGAVGDSISLASDGWASASERYDVRFAGGASDVVVATQSV